MNAKKILIAVSAVVGFLILVLLFGGFSSAVPVDAASVTRGPISEFIDEQAVYPAPEDV